MYTTWQADYNFLRPFAYYAWGAGPNIIHTPLDTNVLAMGSFPVSAHVIPDPFDNNDAVTMVKMNILDSIGNIINSTVLSTSGSNNYSATVTNNYPNGFRYSIAATNSQGITRKLPTYIISRPTMISGVRSISEQTALSLSNHPNPSRSETTFDFSIPHSGFITLRIFDLLGKEVRILFSEYLESGLHSTICNVIDLPAGTYICQLKTSDGIISKQMQILR